MFWKKENENFIGKYRIDINTCDQLIKLYKKTPLGPGGKKAGFIGNNKVDKDIKVSTDLHIDKDKIVKEKCIRQYFEELSSCLEKYKKKYSYSTEQQSSFGLQGANIQGYKKNEGFKKWHYENGGCSVSGKRHLVFMTYLNNCPYGGTEFFYQNKRFKAVKGDTLIWPAAWTHTHKGQISKKQKEIKYIITGWWTHHG